MAIPQTPYIKYEPLVFSHTLQKMKYHKFQQLCDNFVTYGVIIKNQRVLILMKIVKRALRDTILDLDTALDILLVRELHLVIESLSIVPLICSGALHHTFISTILGLLKVLIFLPLLVGVWHLFVETQRFMISCGLWILLSAAPLHEVGLDLFSRVPDRVLSEHAWAADGISLALMLSGVVHCELGQRVILIWSHTLLVIIRERFLVKWCIIVKGNFRHGVL